MNIERRLLIEALPNYEVAEEIGRGGWGVVLEASHKTLNRQVAVKQLPRAFGADPDVRARFLAEARMVAFLDHPHIVPLYDFVERDGMCLLVMEYMSGGTLWDKFQTGTLSQQDAVAVSLAVLAALAHAHEQEILHRDVKPENVLFNAAGVPKLADFGIAKVLGDASATRTATGVIMGTPAYMAPEQGLGRDVTAATDVYAVGVMLYELLSGDLPFPSSGEPLAQLFRHVNETPRPLTEAAADVPSELASVVMLALEKEPTQRPGSALEFGQLLHHAGTQCFGLDWLSNTSFPILDSRILGRGTTPPAAPAVPPPSTPTIVVNTEATPQASQTVTPPAGVYAPPPATVANNTKAETSTSRYLLIGIGIVAAVIVGAVLLFSGGSKDQRQAPTEIPAAAIGRLQGACLQSGVAAAVCDCAVNLAQQELTVTAFMANDELIQRDGDSLTAPVQQIFTRCQEQVERERANNE